MNIYRHGDVLLKPISSIPSSAKEKERKDELTIAFGEATGHHHTLYGAPVGLFEFDENRYLQIKEQVELKHQEHKTLQIEPGCYEIIIEREYDPFEEQLKRVID